MRHIFFKLKTWNTIFYIKRKIEKSNKKLATPLSTEAHDLGHEDVV